MLTCATDPARLLPGFIFFYFTTREGFSHIEAASPGSIARNKTLSPQGLAAIEVPLPSLEAQHWFEALRLKAAAIRALNVAAAKDAASPPCWTRLSGERPKHVARRATAILVEGSKVVRRVTSRVNHGTLLEGRQVDVWIERRSGWLKRSDDARSHGDIDYGRIVHSAAFRRLQGKTQTLNLGDSDFYRNRLTHSIEVAQVSVSLRGQLAQINPNHPGVEHLPEPSLIQAVGLTHDLGHPPFGHGGEIALNYCMRSSGGFEGNGQTLRILSRLEKFSQNEGADLTRRALLGTLKYPVVFEAVKRHGVDPTLTNKTTTVKLLDRELSKPPKCYMSSETDVVDWLLDPLDESDRKQFVEVLLHHNGHAKPIHKSFDCSIMDLADDITFGVHDLEDVVAIGLIREPDFIELVPESVCQHFVSGYHDINFGRFVSMLFGDGSQRKRAISRLVGYFVRNCFIDTIETLNHPLIRYRAEVHEDARRLLDHLTQLVRKRVIFSAEVQQLEFKGQQLVIAVFEALSSEPCKLLPKNSREEYRRSPDKMRHISDYVAGMTDAFLLRTYERLYSPRIGSVFDKL
ncbi:anti-phage deoxyguanosine triphosphatase [Falsiroseomonas sp. E2-1-a4]|uniref:anti-phage deoxyguanosine triphosphatase n=1 Tax=Falsiroseomonas sp. E2-1-a4 TaxID=3239299 RepID=UPI003F2B95B7